MARALLFLVWLVLATSCTNQKRAVRALDAAGYTDVKLEGSAYWCCNGSTYSDSFTAKGPTGVPVKGCVCSGWFKGATIRLQ